MKKGRVTVSGDLTMCDWQDPVLAEVVTLAEACILFDRSQGAIKNVCLIGHVAARRSFTGGSWLISLTSLVKHYGAITPERDFLCQTKTK